VRSLEGVVRWCWGLNPAVALTAGLIDCTIQGKFLLIHFVGIVHQLGQSLGGSKDPSTDSRLCLEQHSDGGNVGRNGTQKSIGLDRLAWRLCLPP